MNFWNLGFGGEGFEEILVLVSGFGVFAGDLGFFCDFGRTSKDLLQ